MGYVHGGDIHTERTYTLKGHTYGEDIHIKETYTLRGHTHKGNIHTEAHGGDICERSSLDLYKGKPLVEPE